jgi:hypothetical protein
VSQQPISPNFTSIEPNSQFIQFKPVSEPVNQQSPSWFSPNSNTPANPTQPAMPASNNNLQNWPQQNQESSFSPTPTQNDQPVNTSVPASNSQWMNSSQTGSFPTTNSQGSPVNPSIWTGNQSVNQLFDQSANQISTATSGQIWTTDVTTSQTPFTPNPTVVASSIPMVTNVQKNNTGLQPTGNIEQISAIDQLFGHQTGFYEESGELMAMKEIKPHLSTQDKPVIAEINHQMNQQNQMYQPPMAEVEAYLIAPTQSTGNHQNQPVEMNNQSRGHQFVEQVSSTQYQPSQPETYAQENLTVRQNSCEVNCLPDKDVVMQEDVRVNHLQLTEEQLKMAVASNQVQVIVNTNQQDTQVN